MKKTLLAILSSATLFATSFDYLTFGFSTLASPDPDMLRNTLPSISYGRRYLFNAFGLDASLGARLGEFNQTLYLQTSPLYYPFKPNRLYLGLGLEGGLAHTEKKLSGKFDLPITLGYQFANAEQRNFVHIQAFPLAYANRKDLALTMSYGLGF